MLKRVCAVILIAAFIISAGPAFCGIIAKNWEFSKNIKILDYAKKVVAIPLDAQVFNSAREDIGDLRVVDAKYAECPYAIISLGGVRRDKLVRIKTTSKEITKTDSVITVELEDNAGAFNGLKIIPESNNFARKVTVEGSNDKKSWEVVRKGIFVYSFAYETTHRYFERYTNEIYEGYRFGKYSGSNLSTQFPECSYKFLRLTVPHDQDKEPVALKDLEIYKTVKAEAEEAACAGIIKKTEPGKDSSIDTIVDFGAKNLGISRVDIAVDGSNFFRRIEIYGSNDLARWDNLASDVIFSISIDDEIERKNTVDVGNDRARYMKIRVFNGDNRPIKISGVTGHYLKKLFVMIPEKDAEYRLLYGNPFAKKVSYDLGELVRGKLAAAFCRGELGKQARNNKYEPYKEAKPWTEERPELLWAAMGIVILGLLYLGSRIVKDMDKK